MAVVASVSSPANGTEAVWRLLTALTANGYVVRRWSDATTLSADNLTLTSNPYVSASSGAGNLGNASAWFRVADTALTREWLFQRGGTDQAWLITRSNTAFTGGSPSPTAAGTSSNSQSLFTTGGNAFHSTTVRQFISVENTAPYGFAMFSITLGGGNVLQFLVDEPLATGTTDASDTDPYLWWGYYNPSGFGVGGAQLTTIWKRFTGAGSNQQSTILPFFISGGFAIPTTSTLGLTPNTLREILLPIYTCRPGVSSSTTGWIGTMSRLRWATITSSPARANGLTIGPMSGAYYILMGGIWVPWDSTEPSLS